MLSICNNLMINDVYIWLILHFAGGMNEFKIIPTFNFKGKKPFDFICKHCHTHSVRIFFS